MDPNPDRALDKNIVFLCLNVFCLASGDKVMQNLFEILQKTFVLDPKCVNFTKLSQFGCVRTCPRRQVFTEWVIFYVFQPLHVFNFLTTIIFHDKNAAGHTIFMKNPSPVGARSGLGPIWAHMGPYGPIYGPIWAHVGLK